MQLYISSTMVEAYRNQYFFDGLGTFIALVAESYRNELFES